MKSIQLQSIGKVPAIPAGELKTGDVLMWNFGYKYSVDSIIKSTEKTITIKTTSLETGRTFEQKLFKNRLVAKVNN